MVLRPARFLFPVALLPVLAWRQTQCFPSEYPRGQLPWTDLHEIASRVPSRWTGTGRPLPVGLFPLSVGPMGGAGNRHGSRQASGSYKTRIFHVESAVFNGEYTELLEITPSIFIDQSTLIQRQFRD